MHAQSSFIRGLIQSETQIPLMGATIQAESLSGTVTDERGSFELELINPTDKVLLKVKMLGYKDLDTLIKIGEREVYLELVLKQNAYLLPTAEVPIEQFNLFFNNAWNLLDHCVLKTNHYVLAYQNNERKLLIFSPEGNLLKQQNLEKKYNRILKSCQNQLHLIGKEDYSKVNYRFGTLEIKPYDGNLFNNLIKKCILKNNEEYIFKEFSGHNKVVKYFTYPEPGRPLLIKEIIDNKAKRASNSYYQQIIREYYRTVEVPDSTNIAFGVRQDNIIAKGEWSGNLKELIVTNELQSLVGYYLNIVSQELNVYEFSVNDTIRIFDLNNYQLYTLGVQKMKKHKISLNREAFGNKSQIVQDQTTDELYLINKSHEVYRINLSKNGVQLHLCTKLSTKNPIYKKYQIDDRALYYISKQRDKPVSKMNRVDLR